MSIIKGTNQVVAGFGGTKRSIGEVYFSQSSLATDNSGALPLFTGETIASANTIYPEFYNWILAHTELQCTSAEYESALSTYGECPKYVVSNGSLRLPKLSNYIKAANTAEGITQKEAGLPNITGSATTWSYKNTLNPTGAFGQTLENALSFNASEKNTGSNLTFDASRSSDVYGKSDTVTPAHTTLYPWVVAYTAAIPASTAQAAEFQQGLSGKVSKSGDTMTNKLTVSQPNIDSILGSAPTTTQYGTAIQFDDKAHNMAGNIGTVYENSGLVRTRMLVARSIDGTYKYAGLNIGLDKSGRAIATSPHPKSSANGDEIATAQWVRNLLNVEISKMLGRMNFNARVDFSIKHKQSYTVPSKGYLWINTITGDGYGGNAYINGGLLAGGYSTDSSGSAYVRAFVPVSAGDVLSAANDNRQGSVTVSGFFVPQI